MTAGSLRAFQEAVLHDLLATGGTTMRLPAASSQAGFAVYRNTVLHGCIDALAANYPTVHQLVGEACFADLGAEFARRCPPDSGTLAAYGAAFADFLATQPAVAEIDYLPAIAMLDRCWTEAHLAVDAPVLRPADVASLGPEGLSRARLAPHPAARWARFETAPAFTIWQRHRDHLPLDEPIDWHGESGLLTRPDNSVEWRAVPTAATAFLDACRDGMAFEVAAESASAVARGDDMSWLPSLLAAGAFTSFEPGEDGP